MTTISVALASYNGARHLPALLYSLTAQHHPPFEVVVSDDGSVDDTAMVVEAAARDSPFPLRFLTHGRPAGFGDNFLHAAAHCRGDWVAFCDQDDLWLPEKLSKVADAAEQADLVLHAGRVVDEGGQFTGKRFPKISRLEAGWRVPVDPLWTVPGFAVVVRRNLLQSAAYDRRPSSRLWANQMNHDEYAWFLAWSLGRIRLLADALVDYRQHDANTVGVPVRGVADSLHKARGAGAGLYAASATLFESYANWFDEELPRHPGSPMAARRWRAIANHWWRRSELYNATGLRSRAECGALVLGCGAYKPRRLGGLGGRSMIKDSLRLAGFMQ